MHKVVAVVIALLVNVVMVAQPAAGGGSWMQWDQPYYLAGETAYGEAGVWTKTTNQGRGRPEDGPYGMYLRPHPGGDYYPSDDPATDPEAIYLGDLTIEHDPAETFGTASFEFLVPDVEPGTYFVDHCSPGCTLELGDLLDSSIRVAAPDQERKLVFGRLERAERRMQAISYRFKRRLSGWIGKQATLMGRVTQLENELDALQAQVESMKPDDPGASGRSALDSSLAYGGVGAAAVLLGAAVIRRRRRS